MDCKLSKMSICDLVTLFKCERDCLAEWTPLYAAIVADLKGPMFLSVNKTKNTTEKCLLDANLSIGSSLTPCMFAIKCNATEALIQLLILGADSSIRGIHGLNALDIAILMGNLDAARICLNREIIPFVQSAPEGKRRWCGIL